MNVVIDKDKKIIYVVSGDSKFVYEEGCKFVLNFLSIKSVKGDIVISFNGGYLFD